MFDGNRNFTSGTPSVVATLSKPLTQPVKFIIWQGDSQSNYNGLKKVEFTLDFEQLGNNQWEWKVGEFMWICVNPATAGNRKFSIKTSGGHGFKRIMALLPTGDNTTLTLS